MAPPDDQIFNQCKLCHLVAKYATNTSGTIWWSNLQLLQVAPSVAMFSLAIVTESISGSVVPLAMFYKVGGSLGFWLGLGVLQILAMVGPLIKTLEACGESIKNVKG